MNAEQRTGGRRPLDEADGILGVQLKVYNNAFDGGRQGAKGVVTLVVLDYTRHLLTPWTTPPCYKC